MCVYVCLSVCLSLASDSTETVVVVIIKFGTVTASDKRMHHAFIILITDLDHENDKYSFISETVQAIPIKFAVKIVQLKVYIIFSQSNDLALH